MVALALGKVRIFANAGVGTLKAGRWNDVDARHPMLGSWLATGLVSHTGPHGESAPARLAQLCCGNR
jgi:hypothetical protein